MSAVRGRLSLVNHPDKSDAPDATAKFMEIATAYEILSSGDVRKAYDDVGSKSLHVVVIVDFDSDASSKPLRGEDH